MTCACEDPKFNGIYHTALSCCRICLALSLTENHREGMYALWRKVYGLDAVAEVQKAVWMIEG